MEQTQKINQIMQALQMKDEQPNATNLMMKDYVPTITGTARTQLVEELVKLLTEPAS
jgi:hypothetical protein